MYMARSFESPMTDELAEAIFRTPPDIDPGAPLSPANVQRDTAKISQPDADWVGFKERLALNLAHAEAVTLVAAQLHEEGRENQDTIKPQIARSHPTVPKNTLLPTKAAPDNLDLPWWHRTACKDQTELFVGPDSECKTWKPIRESMAKAICKRCTVRSECLADALKHNEKTGVWGGMGEDEREELRVSRRALTR